MINACTLLQNATPLFLAAKKGYADVMRMLLHHQADIAAQCNMLYVVSNGCTVAKK